jgi:hypothetical protein
MYLDRLDGDWKQCNYNITNITNSTFNDFSYIQNNNTILKYNCYSTIYISFINSVNVRIRYFLFKNSIFGSIHYIITYLFILSIIIGVFVAIFKKSENVFSNYSLSDEEEEDYN